MYLCDQILIDIAHLITFDFRSLQFSILNSKLITNFNSLITIERISKLVIQFLPLFYLILRLSQYCFRLFQ